MASAHVKELHSVTGRLGRIAVGVALSAALSGCSSMELTTQSLAPGEYLLVKAQMTVNGQRVLCAGW